MSWLILLIPFFTFPLLAQVYELEPIKVDAYKDVDRFTFGTSSTINSSQLETSTSAQVTPALSKVPGMITSQNGGPGGTTSFFIRGTESRQVAFTLDGLKLNDVSNTTRQFDAAFFTSPFLKSVNIYQGPQAVLFGSDAMGGVINFETRKGDNAPETRFSLNGGSFGTVDSSLSSDWKSKKNKGTLTYTRFHTDGISRLNKKRFHATEKDSADITQLTSSSEHQFGEKIKTDFLASYLRGESEQDEFNSDISGSTSRNDQYIIQQKTNLTFSKNDALSLRNGFNRNQRQINSVSQGNDFFNGNLNQNELLYRTGYKDLEILSGLANEMEKGTSDTFSKSSVLNSAFLQSSLMTSQYKFHAGGRFDHHSRYKKFVTGSSGVSYLKKDHTFTLQYSQGFKAPSLYQLYAPNFFGSPVGNRGLVPETNHSWEAIWLLKKKNFNSGLTFFQNRLTNLITFTNNVGYLNQGHFIAEGITGVLGWKGKKVQISSSFTHQNFRKAETIVLRRPQNMAQIQASYFPVETVELSLTEMWYSARFDNDLNGNKVKLNGFEVMDLGVKKTWDRDDVGIELKNIFNREYEELYGFSVLPRSIFAHFGHRFN